MEMAEDAALYMSAGSTSAGCGCARRRSGGSCCRESRSRQTGAEEDAEAKWIDAEIAGLGRGFFGGDGRNA